MWEVLGHLHFSTKYGVLDFPWGRGRHKANVVPISCGHDGGTGEGVLEVKINIFALTSVDPVHPSLHSGSDSCAGLRGSV